MVVAANIKKFAASIALVRRNIISACCSVRGGELFALLVADVLICVVLLLLARVQRGEKFASVQLLPAAGLCCLFAVFERREDSCLSFYDYHHHRG